MTRSAPAQAEAAAVAADAGGAGDLLGNYMPKRVSFSQQSSQLAAAALQLIAYSLCLIVLSVAAGMHAKCSSHHVPFKSAMFKHEHQKKLSAYFECMYRA